MPRKKRTPSGVKVTHVQLANGPATIVQHPIGTVGDNCRPCIGPRLAALRLSRRVNDRPMTQEDLAARVGVGVAAVANWERGRREPSLAMLAAIAEVLDVRMGELFGDGNGS